MDMGRYDEDGARVNGVWRNLETVGNRLWNGV